MESASFKRTELGELECAPGARISPGDGLEAEAAAASWLWPRPSSSASSSLGNHQQRRSDQARRETRPIVRRRAGRLAGGPQGSRSISVSREDDEHDDVCEVVEINECWWGRGVCVARWLPVWFCVVCAGVAAPSFGHMKSLIRAKRHV